MPIVIVSSGFRPSGAISSAALRGFSTASSAPAPLKRSRYRRPFCSPAMVYRVAAILSRATPGNFRATRTPVAASAPTGMPKSAHRAATACSGAASA